MKLLPLRWGLQHGLPRTALRWAAHGGDPVARMILHPADRANPETFYDDIRAQGPVARGRLTYVTASHGAAREVLRSEDFGVGAAFSAYPRPLGRLVEWSRDPAALRVAEPPSLTAIDPPDHTRYRRLVAKVFTRGAIEGLRGRIEEITAQLLDNMDHLARLERTDAVDLVPAFASTLPIMVIAEILGVPEDEIPLLLEFGKRNAPSLDVAQPWRQYRQVDRGVRDFNVWLSGHLERLRRNPGDDLLSQLVNAEDAGEQLTELELRALAGLLLNAGFMTTTTLLSSGVDLFLRHPDQRAWVQDDEERWSNAVHEILRMDCAIRVTARTASCPATVQGTEVPAGSRVVVILTAANRDPDVFTEPDRFDVSRPNAREHLAFAAGRHRCIGAGLALLEGEIGLRRLFERFPQLAPAETPTRTNLWALSGWERVPVSLGAVANRV